MGDLFGQVLQICVSEVDKFTAYNLLEAWGDDDEDDFVADDDFKDDDF
jgi:hypothetical protein